MLQNLQNQVYNNNYCSITRRSSLVPPFTMTNFLPPQLCQLTFSFTFASTATKGGSTVTQPQQPTGTVTTYGLTFYGRTLSMQHKTLNSLHNEDSSCSHWLRYVMQVTFMGLKTVLDCLSPTSSVPAGYRALQWDNYTKASTDFNPVSCALHVQKIKITVQCVTTSLAQTDKQLVMAFWRLTHHMVWLLIIQTHIIQAHRHEHTRARCCTGRARRGARPYVWLAWLSPWQRECWPWQVPIEQLVGSGRLVSKQIYSQSSTACPLNRGRNDKEAIRAKENKDGIVAGLSQSTDGEQENPFPMLVGSSPEVLSVTEERESKWSKKKRRGSEFLRI